MHMPSRGTTPLSRRRDSSAASPAGSLADAEHPSPSPLSSSLLGSMRERLLLARGILFSPTPPQANQSPIAARATSSSSSSSSLSSIRGGVGLLAASTAAARSNDSEEGDISWQVLAAGAGDERGQQRQQHHHHHQRQQQQQQQQQQRHALMPGHGDMNMHHSGIAPASTEVWEGAAQPKISPGGKACTPDRHSRSLDVKGFIRLSARSRHRSEMRFVMRAWYMAARSMKLASRMATRSISAASMHPFDLWVAAAKLHRHDDSLMVVAGSSIFANEGDDDVSPVKMKRDERSERWTDMSVEAASIELLEESRVILANNVEELEKELRDAGKRYEMEAKGMRDEIKRLNAALARAHEEQAEMQISRDSVYVGALSPGSMTGEVVGGVGGSLAASSPGGGDVSANERLSVTGEGRQRKTFAGDDRESLEIEVLRLEESSERLMAKLEDALLLADQEKRKAEEAESAVARTEQQLLDMGEAARRVEGDKISLEKEVVRLEELIGRAEADAREAAEARERSIEGAVELRDSFECAVKEVKRLEDEAEVQAGVNRGLSKRLAEADADLRRMSGEVEEAGRRCEAAEKEVVRLKEEAREAQNLVQEAGRGVEKEMAKAAEASERARRLEGMVEELQREVMRLNREHEDEVMRLKVLEGELIADNSELRREVMRLEEVAGGAGDAEANDRMGALSRALEENQNALEESESGRAELRRGIGRMEHEIEGLGEELRRLSGEKSHVEGVLEKLMVEKEMLEGEVDELKRRCARLEEASIEAEAVFSRAMRAMQQREAEGGEGYESSEALEHGRAALESVSARLEEMEGAMLEMEGAFAVATRDRDALLEEVEVIKGESEVMRLKLEEAEGALEESVVAMGELSQERDELRSKVDAVEREREVERSGMEKVVLLDRLLAESQKAHRDSNEALEEVRGEKREVEEALEKVRGEKREVEEALEEVRGEKREVESRFDAQEAKSQEKEGAYRALEMRERAYREIEFKMKETTSRLDEKVNEVRILEGRLAERDTEVRALQGQIGRQTTTTQTSAKAAPKNGFFGLLRPKMAPANTNSPSASPAVACREGESPISSISNETEHVSSVPASNPSLFSTGGERRQRVEQSSFSLWARVASREAGFADGLASGMGTRWGRALAIGAFESWRCCALCEEVHDIGAVEGGVGQVSRERGSWEEGQRRDLQYAVSCLTGLITAAKHGARGLDALSCADGAWWEDDEEDEYDEEEGGSGGAATSGCSVLVGMAVDDSLRVIAVAPHSPAYESGKVAVGQFVVAVNGTSPKSKEEAAELMSRGRAGGSISVILRGETGEPVDVPLAVVSRSEVAERILLRTRLQRVGAWFQAAVCGLRKSERLRVQMQIDHQEEISGLLSAARRSARQAASAQRKAKHARAHAASCVERDIDQQLRDAEELFVAVEKMAEERASADAMRVSFVDRLVSKAGSLAGMDHRGCGDGLEFVDACLSRIERGEMKGQGGGGWVSSGSAMAAAFSAGWAASVAAANPGVTATGIM